jgi:phosphoribosylanthranilate isomerase
MSFLCKVKISNVTNLSDARYAAAVGIDYIGFCFDPASENYVAPIKAKEMIDWLSGSHIVGEFGNQSPEEIKDISELLNIDVIEVNNRILPDELLHIGKAIIKKIDLAEYNDEQLKNELQAYSSVCDAFHLFHSKSNQEPHTLANLASTFQIIYGFKITPTSVKSVIVTYKPFAINVSGGTEEKVGIKDFDELSDLLEVITIED